MIKRCVVDISSPVVTTDSRLAAGIFFCDGGYREPSVIPTMRRWVRTHPVRQLLWYAKLGKRTKPGESCRRYARQYGG